MPMRKLGRTGVDVSLVGLGGSHLGMATDEQTAVRSSAPPSITASTSWTTAGTTTKATATLDGPRAARRLPPEGAS